MRCGSASAESSGGESGVQGVGAVPSEYVIDQCYVS